jgi:hypothetical protein
MRGCPLGLVDLVGGGMLIGWRYGGVIWIGLRLVWPVEWWGTY